MNSVKTNILANFIGRIWGALLGILFVPLYLKYLSVEFYGIIGIFASVQAILFLLDVGLSPTVNREMARLSSFPEKFREMRDLARTLELPYWAVGILVTIITLLLSPLLAHYWIKSENISDTDITRFLMIMSIGFGFQWVGTFYSSGLLGLQRQVLLNVLNVIFGTLRSFGALIVLAYISPTIQAFLIWQTVVAVINAVVFALAFWKSLPKSEKKAEFRYDLLKSIWRYAAGMTGIGIVTLILTQLDKIILSKMLTLEQFGYYSLANSLAAMGLGMIISSIDAVYYPKFSQIVARNDTNEISQIYHQAAQTLSVFLIPSTLTLAFFAPEILQLWTNDQAIVDNASLLLALIAVGTGLNGFMHIPYFMQLANGMTKLAFWKNVVAIIILIPLMIYAINYYGAVGAAVVWCLLNFSYIVAEVPIMHRFLLKGEMKRWYFEDIGKIILVVIPVFIIGRLFVKYDFTRLEFILSMASISIISFAIAVFSVPFLRNKAFTTLYQKQL